MTGSMVTLQAVVAQLSGEARSAAGKAGEQPAASAFFQALSMTRARLDASREANVPPNGNADPAVSSGAAGLLVASGVHARAEVLAESAEHATGGRLAASDDTLAAQQVGLRVPRDPTSSASSMMLSPLSMGAATRPGDDLDQDREAVVAAASVSLSRQEASLAEPIIAAQTAPVAQPLIADLRGLLAPAASDAVQRGKGLAARGGAANPAMDGQALPNALEQRIATESVQATATLAAGQSPAMLQAGVSHAAAATPAAEADIASSVGVANGALARASEPLPRMHLALEAPLRGAAFASELSDKLVWLAGRQGQWASLSLNPAHLGALEVRLSVAGGDASAQFFSANPLVRDALEAAMPRLRELLADAGITLGEAQVREETFSRRENDGGWSARSTTGGGDASLPAAGAAHVAWGAGGLGLVDLYV